MRKLIFTALFFFSIWAHAADPITQIATAPLPDEKTKWTDFEKYIRSEEQKDAVAGLSYVISGALGTVGGIIGYQSSSDPFAKAVFALSQSIGIAAIGYGAYTWYIGNENNGFFRSVQDTKSLTTVQKDQLLHNYFIEKKTLQQRSRTIKAITHGLIAAVNSYAALRETNPDLRTALFFIAGVNSLVAISFAF